MQHNKANKFFIYRQKSCDSMDSLDSNDVSFIGGSPPMSRYQGN